MAILGDCFIKLFDSTFLQENGAHVMDPVPDATFDMPAFNLRANSVLSYPPYSTSTGRSQSIAVEPEHHSL